MSKQTVTLQDYQWEYYTIEEYKGSFTIEHWENGTFSDTRKGSIGKTNNMKDALSLIRSHSGKEIGAIS